MIAGTFEATETRGTFELAPAAGSGKDFGAPLAEGAFVTLGTAAEVERFMALETFTGMGVIGPAEAFMGVVGTAEAFMGIFGPAEAFMGVAGPAEVFTSIGVAGRAEAFVDMF